jgi:hypothetical protein
MTEVQLPDFEEMMHSVDVIAELALAVSMQKIKIKFMEVKTVRRGVEEGLPVNRIEGAYKYAGYDNEIIPEREELATKESELESARTNQ